MKNLLPIKMALKFPNFPTVFKAIQQSYSECETLEDYSNLCVNLFNEAEIETNIITKKAYESTAKVIYSKITNKTWESQLNV